MPAPDGGNHLNECEPSEQQKRPDFMACNTLPDAQVPPWCCKNPEQKQNAMNVQLRNLSFQTMAYLRISSEPKMSSNQCLISVRSRHLARLGRGAGEQLILFFKARSDLTNPWEQSSAQIITPWRNSASLKCQLKSCFEAREASPRSSEW